MEKIKVILVDDHSLVRMGIKALIASAPDVLVVGEAQNGNELHLVLKNCQPDVALLDIRLPGASGIDVCKNLTANYPKINVLMLSSQLDEHCIVSSLKAGAKGFLHKDCSKEELIEGIRTVYHGSEYLGKNLPKAVFSGLLKGLDAGTAEGKGISEREMQIVRLFAEGMTFREIGDELCISPRTVETHKKNILEKLGLRNTVDLVKYAIKNSLVEL